MDWKLLAAVFGTVFVAELGDKTQMATMLFAAKTPTAKWSVFAGAATALVLSTAIGVLAGAAVTAAVGEKVLHWLAGLGFVGIGLWTLLAA